MVVMFAVIVLFGISVLGLNIITNNFNCGILNEEQCDEVLGCWWNETGINTTVASESDITKAGGRCVINPCLNIINPSGSCGTYDIRSGNTQTCSERSFGTKIEHWCAQQEVGSYNYVDCTSATGTNCLNITRTTGTATEKICNTDSPYFDCELSALVNGGVCRSGTVEFNNQNYTLNCREIDIGGIKVCKDRDGCESLGVSNCVYYPWCMIVDGACVQDYCVGQDYDYITGQCERPETCSGHKLTNVWYNHTYQPSYSTGSTTYRYISTERKYSYDWFCTNKIYNNNPNPHVELGIRGDYEDIYAISNDPTELFNYPDASGGDRCSVARDTCKFCPKYKVDSTECTEGGGVVTNVMGENICTDGRGPYASGASILNTPSVILLVMFFVVLHSFLN